MALPTFPALPGIAFPIPRSPSGRSIRQEAISGKRLILPQRAAVRWTWELSYNFLRSALWTDGTGTVFAELETLTAFYLAQMMSGGAFAYTDDEDNTATAQSFGAGDGASQTFQLVRARSGYVEPVYLPTVTSITAAGTPLVAGTDYTVGATGLVTFATAPAAAAALAWTGTFAWLCRFDDDSLDLSRFMSGLTEAKSLKFSNEISP